MKRSYFRPGILALASVAVWAGPHTPRMATIREQDGTLRPVWGIAANLITGDPLPIGIVQAAAFSNSAGIVLSEGAVRLLTPDGAEIGAYPTSETKPVLAISGLATTAIAWLPADGKLVRWDGSRFVAIRPDVAAIGGTVTDIYLRNDTHAELLVRTDDNSVTRATISLSERRVVHVEGGIPALKGNAIQLDSSLLFEDASGLEIESPSGSMKTLPMHEADLTYERAGASCIHLSASDGRQWLLYMNGSEPALSEIAPVIQSTGSASGGAK
jgi:hypothetical protein